MSTNPLAVRRDPFARGEYERSVWDGVGRSCRWCGMMKARMYGYRWIEDQALGRAGSPEGPFCDFGCFATYHDIDTRRNPDALSESPELLRLEAEHNKRSSNAQLSCYGHSVRLCHCPLSQRWRDAAWKVYERKTGHARPNRPNPRSRSPVGPLVLTESDLAQAKKHGYASRGKDGVWRVLRLDTATGATVLTPFVMAGERKAGGARGTRRNFLPPGATDALDAVDWDHVTKFPGGIRGYARYAADVAARKLRLRKNPSLMLVTGNPGGVSEAALKAAWCRFHQRDTFTGRKVDLGPTPGTPPVTFALGYLYAIDFGTGDCRVATKARVWVCCNPEDSSIWLVSRETMDFSKVAGKAVHALTYDPVEESAKEDAHFKHTFSAPRPTLCPVGHTNGSGAKCSKAALVDGGRYKIDSWIRD